MADRLAQASQELIELAQNDGIADAGDHHVAVAQVLSALDAYRRRSGRRPLRASHKRLGTHLSDEPRSAVNDGVVEGRGRMEWMNAAVMQALLQECAIELGVDERESEVQVLFGGDLLDDLAGEDQMVTTLASRT